MAIDKYWIEDGQRNNWAMPRAAWWKRLPVICRIRAIFLRVAVDRHQRAWSSIGALHSGYDHWVLYGIAHGQERPMLDRSPTSEGDE